MSPSTITTLVSAMSAQSSIIIYITGAVCLVLLQHLDAMIAQVSTAMLVFLVMGKAINSRSAAKEAASYEVERQVKSYEKYEYVPPNRTWSRRTRYQTIAGSYGHPKKCHPTVYHRGYVGKDEMDDKDDDVKPAELAPRSELRQVAALRAASEGPAAPGKYQDLLSAGAKPHLAGLMKERNHHTTIIAEEDAKRLLERLHELESGVEPKRIDGNQYRAVPRRMVAGVRDSLKAMQRGRAQAIVFASDAGADSKVADLMAQATWKGVPVMVAFSRAKLGKMIVRADITATVLVILHAEGCEELFEEVTGKKALPPRNDVVPAEELAVGAGDVVYPWTARGVSKEGTSSADEVDAGSTVTTSCE